MMCEKCNAHPAAVHVQQIINGKKTDSYLCQTCAGEPDSGISLGNLFQDFMDAIFKSAVMSGGVLITEDVKIKCTQCELSFNDFKKTGKLGCSKCYTAFRKELDQILKNLQRSNTHEGKFPHKSGAVLKQKKTLETLRRDLLKAIDSEEFELAATLRDQIKEIEGGDNGGQMV
jgi:protein arginine kinase activator